MIDEFSKLAARVADLERRVKGSFRQGAVAEVDASAGTVRLKLGFGEQGDFLSAPIPYAQVAGAVKVHSPPSVGQQMIAMSPNGDLQQAVAMPLGFSNQNQSPSGSVDQHVLSFGAVTLELTSSGLTVSVGGTSVTIDSSGLSVSGGDVIHNGTGIGDNHSHSGVEAGGSRTGSPK